MLTRVPPQVDGEVVPARGHVVAFRALEAGLDVCVLVCQQLRTGGRGEGALVTDKGPGLAVRLNVLRQMVLPRRPVVTRRALERPLARVVHPYVRVEIGLLLARIIAELLMVLMTMMTN